MISSILFQLTRNLTPEQIKAQGFDTYFVDHTTGVYPQAASGMPFSTAIKCAVTEEINRSFGFSFPVTAPKDDLRLIPYKTGYPLRTK